MLTWISPRGDTVRIPERGEFGGVDGDIVSQFLTFSWQSAHRARDSLSYAVALPSNGQRQRYVELGACGVEIPSVHLYFMSVD
ncbi:hypothetical protein FGB62_53g110 [Gracilaria domingensis]|nr:hypothetical protein FGB62_53g110 [Gracilaria domingensis]